MSSQQVNDQVSVRSVPRPINGQPEIAVVGMSGRFPGAETIDEFWQNLRDGIESISFLSDEEVVSSGVDSRWLTHPHYVKASPILSEIEMFDAEFFGLSAREAKVLDPQHRLFLECAWEAMEHAGYNPLTYEGAIGVYAGALMNTYLVNNLYPNRHLLESENGFQAMTVDSMSGFQVMITNDKDYLPMRVSYHLNLTGPSVNVQTGCSTSLVAIHLACQSILNGECDMALAGGVSIKVPQKTGYLYKEGMIFSPDGHCRVFDAKAQGTLFGNGAGVVLLKRLEDATADRDYIYAVIKGSAVNNNGSLKLGYTVPSAEGQAAVISKAITLSGVDPETITYVEAHGTGTAVGDPIEVMGLTQAFRASTDKQDFCALGSVKTNIGHLQVAAGVVGFIKTVLALQHKMLPAHLHFEQLNPQIDFANSPFYVNTTLSEWKTSKTPRRAGVGSLGVGGTNAHVVLEEASAIQRVNNEIERPQHLLTLSARNEQALRELAHKYHNFFATHTDVSLADVCFTANTGRVHFDHRLAVVAESTLKLLEILGVFAADQPTPGLVRGQISGKNLPKIAFLFTGQGSQYVGMGHQLYETQPTFRQTLDRCDRILRDYLEKPLLEVLYLLETGNRGLGTEISNVPCPMPNLIDETAYTQPALFALEYALAELWRSWGIEPTVVMGHSVGEYVAACVAGVFSLEDGLKLIALRGRLMQTLSTDGEMVAVFTNQSQVQAAIQPHAEKVAIAALNGPQNIVISGDRQAVRSAVAILESQGVETRQLKVSHAFHSPLIEPMLGDFERVASRVTFSPPKIDIISNLTGELVTAQIATPEYWCNHVRQAVRFAAGMESLYQKGCEVFLEIGAKPILLGMGRSCLPEENVAVWLPSLRPGQSDWQQLLQTLGELYIRGVPVNWSAFDQDYERYRLALPTYSFQRQHYWIGSPENSSSVKEHSSSQGQITKTLNLLSQGEIKQLVQYLEKVEQFSEVEAKLLPKLLEALFKQHQQEQKDESTSEPQQPEILRLLEKSLPQERLELLVAHIQSEAAQILGLVSSTAPAPHLGFFEMGMDSLMVVELRNRLTNNLGHSLSTTVTFNYPTIEALARYFNNEVFSFTSLEEPHEFITNDEKIDAIAVQLEEISEEEMAALLLEKLQAI